MGDYKDLPGRINAINDQLVALQSSMQGVNPQNLQQFFVMHRHDGSALGGQALHGPYFIRDTANGKTYKLVCTNGTLGVRVV